MGTVLHGVTWSRCYRSTLRLRACLKAATAVSWSRNCLCLKELEKSYPSVEENACGAPCWTDNDTAAKWNMKKHETSRCCLICVKLTRTSWNNLVLWSSCLWIPTLVRLSANWANLRSRAGVGKAGGSQPSRKVRTHGGKYWSLGHSSLEVQEDRKRKVSVCLKI